MGYSDYVAALVKELGGTQNIIRATHCATRLRFSVRDRSGIDKEKIKAIKGTAGVIEANGTIQVVIGTHVGDVYEELMRIAAVVASAAVGGLICGIFKCYVTNFAFTGLFGLPAFASSPTAIPYFGAVLVTIALAFGITFIFEKRKGGK